MTDAKPKSFTWVPLLGQFEIDETNLVFMGGEVPAATDGPTATTDHQSPKKSATFGIALCNQTLSDGDVSLDVVFAGDTSESTCEISIAYDPNAYHFVDAGIGGDYATMYTIREWGGPNTGAGKWWNHRSSGDRKNLKADVPYHVEAKFRGATVTLSIDGVTVGSSEVGSPIGRERQVGVFCRGRGDVRVTNFKVSAEKPKAFVVMQFGDQFDELYKDVVAEVCKNYEVKAIRADQMSGPGLVISDIVGEINTSQLVIADISPVENANVYFEVGYALALNKPTILLARKGTALPFDVAGFRVLFYENTIGGKNRLEEGLRRHLDAILLK
jgi:hypothetical protein